MPSLASLRPMFRLARSLCLGALLALMLAACQPSGRDDAGAGGTRPDPAAGVSDLAALGRYFVTSFEAFDAVAERLQTDDPRYRLQRNRWTFSGRTGVLDSYPLASARVQFAHAAGLTGAGRVVSVVDSGFRTSHEVFAGRTLSFPFDLPVDDHGTGVASVLAGSSATMIGVAPGASLALGSFQSAATRAESLREAIRLDAVAQNNSWGFEIDVSQSAFDAVFSGGADYLEALGAYAGRGVVVFAVSNDAGRTRSSLMEALPVLRPEFERGWIAVANAVPTFDEERVLSARLVSAGCLDAARWCITADGGWVSARAGGDAAYGFATGSSFAAPQVSGALALLAEAFPDLTPHQLRLRLLASADNGFFIPDGTVELAPGVLRGYSRDYGLGFLDLRAALLPIGTPVVPAATGGATVAGEPIVMSGSAIGDAVARALADQEVLVVDGLGGEFRMEADALVARPVPQPLADRRLAALARGGAGGALGSARSGADLVDRLPVTRVSIAPAGDGLGIELLLPADPDRAAAYGIGLQARLGTLERSLRVGARLMRDGTGATGLSGLDDGAAAYSGILELETQARLVPAATVTAYAQIGLSAGGEDGEVMGRSVTRFSSVGFDLRVAGAFRSGDRLSMGLSMPTAVTSGSARLTLPVSRTAGGIVFAQVPVDLSPEDRELRLSASYAAPLAGGWSLVAEGVHAVNRGHVRGETDTGAVLGFRIAF